MVRIQIQPANEQLDIAPSNTERIELVPGAPAQEHLQVGERCEPGTALVASQMRSDRHPEQIIRNTLENDRIGHTPTVPAPVDRSISGRRE